MEIKEAIEWLKSIDKKHTHGGDEGFDSKRHEAMRMAISALEKQKAKKPLPVSNDSTWSKCPVCGGTNIDEYCGKCGQRIDWSE